MILNSIRKQYPTLGTAFYDAPTGIVLPAASPQSGFQTFGNSISYGGAAVSLNFPTGVTFSRGKIRVRIYNMSGANTLVSRVYLWDGTNAVDVILPTTATTPINTNYSSGAELVREFCTEIAATGLVAYTTVASPGTASVDLECYGTA